jgi:hypothetical protein
MTLWAFDIETEAWSHFVLGVAVSDTGECRHFTTDRQVADWYRSTESRDVIVSHNGGRYDALYLIDVIDAPWTVQLAGSRINAARVKGHAEVRDSFSLVPLGLGRWTGADKSTGLMCRCGQTCGGYCSIKVRGMPRAEWRALRDYCERDARALLTEYQATVAALESWGWAVRDSNGRIRRTMGGVALATAAASIGDDPREVWRSLGAPGTDDPPSWTDYQEARRGYYGGRCEVFRTVADAGHRYDLNSAYPWSLTLTVPHGRSRHVGPRGATTAAARQTPGIYEADVALPDGPFPSLPHRVGGEDDARIVWATGHVTGHWTLPELEAARARGAVIELRGAMLFATESPVFAPFIAWAFPQRRRDTRWCDTWVKLAMNSVSGKLAQGPEADVVLVRPSELPRGASWVGGDVWRVAQRRVPATACPAMAAYLTSRTRIALLARLERQGDDAIYADTDSCYSRVADARDVGTSLGQWKDEGPMTRWCALAPKVYTFASSSTGVLTFKARAKGIPQATPATIDQLARGEKVRRVAGVRSLLQAAAGKRPELFQAAALERCNRRPAFLAGTRYVLSTDELTVPMRRDEDGCYDWPGVATLPGELRATPREPGTLGPFVLPWARRGRQ